MDLHYQNVQFPHTISTTMIKTIIEKKISEYCYCALRFADKERIHTVFQNVYKLYKRYDFSLNAKQ